MLEVPSYHAIAAMAVTIAMFIAFARGRYTVEIISLITIAVIGVGLYFAPLEGTKPTDGLALAFGGFGHQALITICALMIMGRGLVVTGALEPFARLLERVFRSNGQIGLLFALLIAFTLSMFVNDTPVMVLMLPILVALAGKGVVASSKTLMPVNSAVLIGGMGTTIGTSTNILVVSIAEDIGMETIGVFQFTPIVLIAAVAALPYLWLVMPRLLRDNSVIPENIRRVFHTRLRVGSSSLLAGAELAAIQDKLPQGITFHDQPTGALQPQQRLHISGTHEAIEEAARALKGELAPSWVLDRIRRVAKDQGEDIVAVEMTVTADSRLISRTLASSGIADLYGSRSGISPPGPSTGRTRQPIPRRAIFASSKGTCCLVMGLRKSCKNFANNERVAGGLKGARELPRRSEGGAGSALKSGWGRIARPRSASVVSMRVLCPDQAADCHCPRSRRDPECS